MPAQFLGQTHEATRRRPRRRSEARVAEARFQKNLLIGQFAPLHRTDDPSGFRVGPNRLRDRPRTKAVVRRADRFERASPPNPGAAEAFPTGLTQFRGNRDRRPRRGHFRKLYHKRPFRPAGSQHITGPTEYVLLETAAADRPYLGSLGRYEQPRTGASIGRTPLL